MFCAQCGSEQSEEAIYCRQCGAPLQVKNRMDLHSPAKEEHTLSKRTKSREVLLLSVLLLIAAAVAAVEAVFIFRNQSNGTGISQQELTRWRDTVTTAKQAVVQEWETIYADSLARGQSTDGYMEIKDTRVIEIAPNSNEYFSNISAVVEFVLYTDYFGSTPYYSNAHRADSVVFYTDGSYEVCDKNPFELYFAQTYSSDYSDLIAGIHDLKSGFNETYDLR